MLICSTMTTTTKKCLSCEKTLEVSEFSTGRNTCRACKAQNYKSKVSGSYESFLRHIYTQSKSCIKSGKRNGDLEWSIELDDLISLWEKQDGKCALSGVYLTHHKDGSGHKDYNASIDRISGEKGYTYHNVQLVCYRVNLMKHTLSEDMFYWWTKTINDFSCD